MKTFDRFLFIHIGHVRWICESMWKNWMLWKYIVNRCSSVWIKSTRMATFGENSSASLSTYYTLWFKLSSEDRWETWPSISPIRKAFVHEPSSFLVIHFQNVDLLIHDRQMTEIDMNSTTATITKLENFFQQVKILIQSELSCISMRII